MFTVCVCVVLRRGSRGEILVRDLCTVRGGGGGLGVRFSLPFAVIVAL